MQLVDESGRTVGSADKLEAHEPPGRWHRALSVFLFDQRDRLLVQKRADTKYHFGSLWSNTCCSHPRPGEDVNVAGSRRVGEELGITIEPDALDDRGVLRYEAIDPVSGLVEREWDHLLVGRFEGSCVLNPAEVSRCRWMGGNELTAALATHPGDYTPWFAMAWERLSP